MDVVSQEMDLKKKKRWTNEDLKQPRGYGAKKGIGGEDLN